MHIDFKSMYCYLYYRSFQRCEEDFEGVRVNFAPFPVRDAECGTFSATTGRLDLQGLRPHFQRSAYTSL
jgi:hypothetical protein